MRHAYINAIIWTAASEPIDGGTLLVEDGKIVSVGTDLDTDGYKIVDCAGKYLLPGFIDAHVHTGVWGEGARDDHDANEVTDAIRTCGCSMPSTRRTSVSRTPGAAV